MGPTRVIPPVPTSIARMTRVLLAEDDPAISEPLARALRREGFDTDLASGLEVEDGRWAATAFSGDRAEGVAAFNEKRRPEWPGR